MKNKLDKKQELINDFCDNCVDNIICLKVPSMPCFYYFNKRIGKQ